MPALTLLDINGDYFNLYWDNDATSLNKNRYPLILFDESNNISRPTYNGSLTIYLQNNTDVYFREFLGLVVSIIYFLFLFYYLILEKKIQDLY